jgi:hypothetical protein
MLESEGRAFNLQTERNGIVCNLPRSQLTCTTREAYAPELDAEKFPPTLQMKSVHNTPIEGLWHWFLQTFGVNIKDTIRRGYETGNYNPNNLVHVYALQVNSLLPCPDKFTSNLFYWLWPKILQNQLDQFVEFWNNHKIRSQKEKINMSGATPRHGFTVPEPPAQDCRIVIDQPAIDALRLQIPISRSESMRWVDDTFAAAAQDAYKMVGSPSLNDLLSGWDIFSAIAPLINVASTLI